VFRLPVGDHEVLVRFESIQVAQNLVINNVLSWEAQQPVTFSEYQDRAVGDGVGTSATPNGDHEIAAAAGRRSSGTRTTIGTQPLDTTANRTPYPPTVISDHK